MTEQDFYNRWRDVLDGKKNVDAIVSEEMQVAGETTPPPLMNPTISAKRTIDDFRRDQMKRLLGGQ